MESCNGPKFCQCFRHRRHFYQEGLANQKIRKWIVVCPYLQPSLAWSMKCQWHEKPCLTLEHIFVRSEILHHFDIQFVQFLKSNLCFDLSGMCWLRMHGFVNEHNGQFEQWNSWGWKIYVMWDEVIFHEPSNLMWSHYLNMLKYFINSGHFTMYERIKGPKQTKKMSDIAAQVVLTVT